MLDGLIMLVFNSKVTHTAEIARTARCIHRGMSVGIHSDAKIGERVLIGIHVVIGGKAQAVGPPVIEDDVFLGTNAIVLCQRVGRGAIVGAGSVVLDDIPPGAVVAGNPAEIIRYSDRPYWADEPRRAENGDRGLIDHATEAAVQSALTGAGRFASAEKARS